MLESLQKCFKEKTGTGSSGNDNPDDSGFYQRPYGRNDTRNYLARHIKEEKAMRKTKKRWNKKGMGTVEIVIIIAVLVALALLFRTGLTEYGEKVMDFCFDDSKIASAF